MGLKSAGIAAEPEFPFGLHAPAARPFAEFSVKPRPACGGGRKPKETIAPG